MEKRKVPPVKFSILIDTREKPQHRIFQPGDADADDHPVVGYELATLNTGDYAIKEAPHLVCVEKKKKTVKNFILTLCIIAIVLCASLIA